MCRKSVCFVSAVLFLALAGRASGDLIGWWKFDDGAGSVAVDSSGNGNDATVQGSAKWVEGKVGSGALSFDGVNGIVQANESPLMDIDKTLTIAAWVYLNNLSTFYFILDKSPSGTAAANYPGNYEFRVAQSTGALQLGHQTSQSIDYVFYDSTSAIKAGRWYHVAVTFVKGVSVKFYIDGSPAGNLTQTAAFGILNDEPIRIGGRKDSYSFFNGMLDDVRIYNNALSDADIKKLAARPKAYDPQPPSGTTGVLQPLVQWTSGTFAQWHDVYFGTTPDLGQADFKGRQNVFMAMYWNFAGLQPGTTYYWRVDEVEPNNAVHTGDVWNFTAAPATAFDPLPRNGDKWIDPNADLSWKPGMGAIKHNLYFGTDRAKVEARDASVSKGSPVAATYEPGTLAEQTTYYWVVDEAGATTVPGEVWSFTTLGGPGGVKGEYFNNTVRDISGTPALTRIDPAINFNWINDGPGAPIGTDHFSVRWTADLEIAVADTYTFIGNSDDGLRLWLNDRLIIDAWIDRGAADSLSNPQKLDPGIYSLMMEYYEWEGGASAQLFWQTPTVARQIVPSGALQPPVRARAIYPKNGDVNVPQDITLTWSAGEKAVTHDVYFGEDEAAVAAAAPADTAIYKGSQGKDENTFAPGALEFNKTYYWRVDEVNDAAADSPWKSPVWSFTTADFIIVDDFETYTNDSPNRLFQTWIDGWGFSPDDFFPDGDPGNGTSASVGHDIWAAGSPYTTIMETSIVHPGGSRKSMPFDYNNINGPYYSQTDRTWASGQNWTLNSSDALSLWFHGYPPKFLDSGTTITLSGAGSDIYGGVDEFRFAYKKLTGDGSISVKVESVQVLEAWTKAGVMIRESLDPLAMQAHMITAAQQKLVEWMYRAISGDTVTVQPTTAAGSTPLPVWVRVTRAGNVFTGEYSTNGTTWTKITLTDGTVSSTTLVMPSTVYIGMVVCSHVAGSSAVADFSDIKVSGSVTGAWQTVDMTLAQPGNDPDQLYVIVQDSTGKSVTLNHPDGVNAVLSNAWTEWQIPLSQFTGVNPAKIKKMSIGVGNPKSPKADGHGVLYFDDIRVIKPTP